MGSGPTEGTGFGSGFRIWISGRTSSSSPDSCAIFRRSLSPRQRRPDVFFFLFFPPVPELILHPNPIFGTDFVGKGLALRDLEKLESPSFRLPCRRCLAYGIRLKPTPDVCKGFWDYFCGVKWGFSTSIRTLQLRRSSVGFLFSLIFPYRSRFFAGVFRVAEGRGRDFFGIPALGRPLWVVCERKLRRTPEFSALLTTIIFFIFFIFYLLFFFYSSVTLYNLKLNIIITYG